MYLQVGLGYTALMAGAVFLPVGIIQGIMAPISGIFSDKINGRVPLILGVVLLAFSFYLNSMLTMQTEHAFIMLSLYIRGFAMGILFTPLSTISLIDIPREKMAQASGLSNTLRQLGGSLGVALLATLLTSRVGYHNEMYAESINPRSQTYQTAVSHLTYSIERSAGSSPMVASKQSQALIVSNISKQAYIQGIDDDFLIAAIITLIGGAPIFFLHVKKKKQSINIPTHE
jgi:DHA2 family multidrug resistance protein